MRRVALVCEPPDGGVAEHVVHLALGLPLHGYEPTVVTSPDFVFRERLVAAGVPLLTVGFERGYSRPQRDLLALSQLVRLLHRGSFDLVHAHAAKAGVLGRLAAAIIRTPAIYSPHCFPFVGDITESRRRFGVAVERALGGLTRTIVCVCDDERRQAVRNRIHARSELVIVRNGCPACAGVPPDPALTALRARGPLVGTVSVLRRQKRVDVLLAAWPRVLAAIPEAQLAIVGEGPEGPALRAMAARLGLDIAFVPFLAPSARALQALDLFVLPSAWEAFPIGVLEAQACGVPQVVTRVGGIPEAVTPETGVLVEAGNADALAGAIVNLLGDGERRRSMAAASRARHAEHFTVERMLVETAAVYDTALERTPA